MTLLQLVAWFYRNAKTLCTMSLHVEARCRRLPITINTYHAAVLGKGIDAFACKDIITGKHLNKAVASQVARAYKVPTNTLGEDFNSISRHMPYNTKPAKAHMLVGDWEETPFNLFLSRALLSHPTNVMTSLRKSQDQIHIGGFLAAIWFGLYITGPCLQVSGNPSVIPVLLHNQ